MTPTMFGSKIAHRYRILPNLSPGASFRLKFNITILPPNLGPPPRINWWKFYGEAVIKHQFKQESATTS